MTDFILELCRASLASTFCTSKTPHMSAPTLPEQILDACRGNSSPKLRTLLKEWEKLLLKRDAGSGSTEIVQQLTDHYDTNKAIYQAMLGVAAQKGNVDGYRFLLQQRPDAEISDDVRSNALEGGVKSWKVIFDHSPRLINYDFGEKGDLICMAVLMRDMPLLAYFLEKGLDPNASHFFCRPIIDVATTDPAIGQEIVNLLVQHGATTEKSMAANKVWRNA